MFDLRKLLGLCLTIFALVMVVGTVSPATITLYNRSAEAELVSDADGLLSIMGVGPYAQIVNYDSEGRVFLDFNDLPHATFAPWAEGLNPDSENIIYPLLQIHNSGPEDYDITISSDNPRIQFFTVPGQWYSGIGPAQSITVNNVPSGWSIWLGVVVDATGLGEGDTISAAITITADNP